MSFGQSRSQFPRNQMQWSNDRNFNCGQQNRNFQNVGRGGRGNWNVGPYGDFGGSYREFNNNSSGHYQGHYNNGGGQRIPSLMEVNPRFPRSQDHAQNQHVKQNCGRNIQKSNSANSHKGSKYQQNLHYPKIVPLEPDVYKEGGREKNTQGGKAETCKKIQTLGSDPKAESLVNKEMSKLTVNSEENAGRVWCC